MLPNVHTSTDTENCGLDWSMFNQNCADNIQVARVAPKSRADVYINCAHAQKVAGIIWHLQLTQRGWQSLD